MTEQWTPQRRDQLLNRVSRTTLVTGAAALAANPVDVNVVFHQMREIGRHRVVRKSRQADLSAAVGHVNGLIDGGFGAGALHHIIRADAAP